MLKILQAKLQQYQELTDVETRFRKGRGTRDQIANIHWILEKAREFQKTTYLCFIDYTKAFDSVDHKKHQKILRDRNTRSPYLSPVNCSIPSSNCMRVKKQQLELDMEQLTSSKLGKE